MQPEFTPDNILETYSQIKSGPEQSRGLIVRETPWRHIVASSEKIFKIAADLTERSIGIKPGQLVTQFQKSWDIIRGEIIPFYGSGGRIAELTNSNNEKIIDVVNNLPKKVNTQILPELVDAAGITLPKDYDAIRVARELPFRNIVNIIDKIVPPSTGEKSITDTEQIISITTEYTKSWGQTYQNKVLDAIKPRLIDKMDYKKLPELQTVGELAGREANETWQLLKLLQNDLEVQIYNQEFDDTSTLPRSERKNARAKLKQPKRLEASQFNSFDDMVKEAFKEYSKKNNLPVARIMVAVKVLLDLMQY